ncbi:hypothetical protein PENPOL_c006G06805 [Penicillium polonicum]|uniref:Uncharacterized protein n=1 Tax=Penicillium polonicum TaxID=60169 RepID=A0A1V6NKL9_PENPO|nr:hypothetical protein PENPOL_c006G06805 [Penicillium polonicum]
MRSDVYDLTSSWPPVLGGAGRENSGRGVPRSGGGRGALHGAATGAPGLATAPAGNPGVLQTPDTRNAPLTPRDQSHNNFALVHTPGFPLREAPRGKLAHFAMFFSNPLSYRSFSTAMYAL